MRRVAMSLLLAVISLSSTACSAERTPTALELKAAAGPQQVVQKTAPPERKSVASIATTGGICSATKMSATVILSAAHCFRDATKLIIIDGKPATIERVLQDGNDHALVVLGGITLTNFATMGPPPREGDNVHYWGNPHIFSMLLRRGYVSGFEGGINTLYDINGYRGDSGSGVFDEKARLTGVISYIHFADSFSMMGSYPLNFTKEQLASIGLAPNQFLTTDVKAKVLLSHPSY